MAIYAKNADALTAAFDKDGELLTSAYDIAGDEVFNASSGGYYKGVFDGYVDTYINKHGLYIDGEPATESEISEYLLNRNNCIYRGKLAKSGQYLVDKNGNNIDLQGIGTHHLTQYSNLHTLQSLAELKYCGVNCIRLSAYLNNHAFKYSDGQIGNGYLITPDAVKSEMDRIIEHCIRLGLYVIVDWHVFSGGGETLNTSSAVEFFSYFANRYSACENVLYELANEPFDDSLEDLTSHCKTLRTLIYGYVTNPVLICGVKYDAPQLYNALLAEGISDIFISHHRYSGERGVGAFRDYWSRGIPLFISEWSCAESSGATTITEAQKEVGDEFLAFFRENHIPHCIWKFTDQTAGYSVLANRGSINSSYYKSGSYAETDYSEYGKYYFDKFSEYMFNDSQ